MPTPTICPVRLFQAEDRRQGCHRRAHPRGAAHFSAGVQRRGRLWRRLRVRPPVQGRRAHQYAWETTVGEERGRNVHVHDGVSEEEFVTIRQTRDEMLAAPLLLALDPSQYPRRPFPAGGGRRRGLSEGAGEAGGVNGQHRCMWKGPEPSGPFSLHAAAIWSRSAAAAYGASAIGCGRLSSGWRHAQWR